MNESSEKSSPAETKLSDSEQQTDLENTAIQELQKLRNSIDNLDAALVHILAERFRATQRVGHLKAEYSLPAGDPDREEEQIKRLRSLAVSADLDPEFAEQFLNFIISEVNKHHEKIARESTN
ncbi:chorismate mutase [uncultured Rothia sp.]|uniref:chorismate mutase n=1 Tax=uncultured Rothia sp. TaxID=316088 RepID=UPI0032162632